MCVLGNQCSFLLKTSLRGHLLGLLASHTHSRHHILRFLVPGLQVFYLMWPGTHTVVQGWLSWASTIDCRPSCGPSSGSGKADRCFFELSIFFFDKLTAHIVYLIFLNFFICEVGLIERFPTSLGVSIVRNSIAYLHSAFFFKKNLFICLKE